jgi:ABC-type antimicrobial peptide transport system permease subunit
MLKNYFKIAFRNLVKNKVYSFINIAGLATGMAVAMLIGLWIYDELSFDKKIANYDRIGQVWQFVTFDVEKASYNVMPIPMAEELRTKYPDFKYVSLTSENFSMILANGDKKLTKTGNYVQPDFTEMMSLKMVAGNRNGLKDMNSVLLSGSVAKSFFGSENPIDKIIKINNKLDVKVAGVYEDFPDNSSFKDVLFLAPWDLWAANEGWVKDSKNNWDNNSFKVYAQLREGVDFKNISAKIRDIRMKKDNPPGYKPEFFLLPMSRWHLYSDFKNGVNTGGLIEFVWLFGIIGVFVLLLACINFMNLSTARSERRAKEVGIRKAIGSLRRQLILQFFSESLLVVAVAFGLSLILVQLILPFFNEVSGKKMTILWSNPLFWLLGLGFSLLTGLIAGSYPALYLSSFQPIKVLKGTFRVGRFAAIPRKVLVVLQFTVSVTLIIGTIIVFRQIQYAKDLPVGYSSNGLIEINMNTPELYGHYQTLRNDLLNTGAVYEFSESSGSITEQSGGATDFFWRGKDPTSHPLVMSNSITHDFGKTIGWHVAAGRDFSRAFTKDSAGIIVNEAMVKLIGIKDPVGESVKRGDKEYKVIGIVKDMIRESPFQPVKPSFFTLDYGSVSVIDIRLAPQLAASEALGKIEKVFRKYNPGSPFTYTFVDEGYAKKFGTEERIGKLASFFAILAIFISCLGLFGLASFVAEQRTREIGVRKVLGASVVNVCRLLSGEFIVLVIISLLIATPTAYYFMHNWLQNYQYRTEITGWIFASVGFGALVITLLTVGFQAIRAAIANPVKSLRTE